MLSTMLPPLGAPPLPVAPALPSLPHALASIAPAIRPRIFRFMTMLPSRFGRVDERELVDAADRLQAVEEAAVGACLGDVLEAVERRRVSDLLERAEVHVGEEAAWIDAQ